MSVASINDQADPLPVKLFWTGGWDSTFQLLRVLLLQKRSLLPYYLIDVDRRSTAVELKTMRRIKDKVLDRYPDARERLLPTRYFAVTDVRPDTGISDAFRAIRKNFPVGDQYEWLAWFCKGEGITDIQVSLEKPFPIRKIGAPPHICDYIGGFAAEFDDGGSSCFRLPDQLSGRHEHTLFGRYSFPLFDLTKLDMAARAEEHGWTDIMNMTWFCHWPTRRMKPCGRCNPCLQAIQYGMGWRIPLKGRILSHFSKGY